MLFKFNFLFLSTNLQKNKNIIIFIESSILYYTIAHLKFTTLFYSSQLSDIFSYEIPKNKKNAVHEIDNLLVYNIHLIQSQQRFFVFTKSLTANNSYDDVKTTSITELFYNASWLEREISELNGLFFSGKKDNRNLMLQYGDKSAPFQRSFPAVGAREIFYDLINDYLIQIPTTLQL